MKNFWTLLLLLCLGLATSCNKKEEAETIKVPVTDQKIPGTNLDLTGSIRGVYNIKICPNGKANPGYECPPETQGREDATLSWEIPALYRTEDWFVVIYRAHQAGNENLQLNLAQDAKSKRTFPATGNAIFEVKRLKDTTWTDESVVPGAKYFYWIFLVIQGEEKIARDSKGYWSPADRKELEFTGVSGGAQFPTAENFWKSYAIGGTVKWSDLVYAPAGSSGQPIYSYRSMKAGTPSIGKPKGRIALANNGAVLLATDTNNNRVLIFENKTALTCEESFPNDPLSLYACLLQAEGQPPYPVNILGQPDDKSVLSCQEHQNVCGSYTSYCANVVSACSAALTQEDCHPINGPGPQVPGQMEQRICFWNVAQNTCQPLATTCSNETQCLSNHTLGNNSETSPSFCKWENNSCKVKASDCMTEPTEVITSDTNEVLISDSGNHRILYYDNTRFAVQSGGLTFKYLIGCDGDINPIATNPTKCTPDKVIGKPSMEDLSLHDLNAWGASALNYPTGLALLNDDLYIADTKNNRVVKAYSFRDPNQYLCNEDTWGTGLCQWRGLLGQADFISNYTFKDFFAVDNTLLGGTFNNEVQESIGSPTKPNNLPYWVGESQDILKRYFRNPTKIKIVNRDEKNYLLVLAHEDFNATTGIGTQVSLRSRILRFDNGPLVGATPQCNQGNFDSDKCVASEVIGQETFKKLVILSGVTGGTGSYQGSVFTLDNIDDLEMMGPARLVALSGTSNEIYSWHDFLNKEANGFPYNLKIVNPEGAVASNGQPMPNLQGLGGLVYDAFNAKCYVVDAKGSKVWQLDFLPMDSF